MGEGLSRPLAGQAWSKLGSLAATFWVGILRAPVRTRMVGSTPPCLVLGACLSRRNQEGI